MGTEPPILHHKLTMGIGLGLIQSPPIMEGPGHRLTSSMAWIKGYHSQADFSMRDLVISRRKSIHGDTQDFYMFYLTTAALNEIFEIGQAASGILLIWTAVQ